MICRSFQWLLLTPRKILTFKLFVQIDSTARRHFYEPQMVFVDQIQRVGETCLLSMSPRTFYESSIRSRSSQALSNLSIHEERSTVRNLVYDPQNESVHPKFLKLFQLSNQSTTRFQVYNSQTSIHSFQTQKYNCSKFSTNIQERARRRDHDP